MEVNLNELSESQALEYLDKLTDKGLTKEQATIAFFSINKLKDALTQLTDFRETKSSAQKDG